MISAEEALETAPRVARRLEPITVPLHEALGKELAEEIPAADPLPPFPASIKDGYAVVAADGSGEHPVITESRAGNDGLGVTVTPGNCCLCDDRRQIRDSNRSMLLAAAVQQNYKIVDLGIAWDDEPDIILTSGGVSMGDRDFVKPLLQKRGKVHFEKVCMKPGKPVTFAEINPGETADGVKDKNNSYLLCSRIRV
ncbi:Molybdopterin biosynthesis protein CNX1-like protein [Drosera capensis]